MRLIERIKDLRPKTTSDWLLLVAMAGVSFVNPGVVAKAILEMIKEESTDKRSSQLTARKVSRAIYELKKRKIIEFKEEADKTILVLTEKGKQRALRFSVDSIIPPKMQKWDHRWRMLMFDIPEKEKSARGIFRDKLKKMGFLQFQKSIWIYPYPCEDEVDFLAEYFHIAQYINLLTVSIEDDDPLRTYFKV